MGKPLKILELFAGVGGFRIGLEHADKNTFQTCWSNQYEPARKSQDAFEVYNYHFPDSDNIGIDINDISDKKFKSMDADMIVGGFPCQDYSVARTTHGELGIQGKKGVLFWQIIRAAQNIRPKYMLFENVDRLLKAPSKQRGRDFSIMLSALNKLGYSLEWRVINAADYGGPQRRRRVYIFVFRNDLAYAKHLDKKYGEIKDPSEHDAYYSYVMKEGLFGKQFPVKNIPYKGRIASYVFPEDVVDTSDNFKGNVFNSGIMHHGRFFTVDTKALGNEKPTPLGDILQPESAVNANYYITDQNKINKFKYLRGAKKIERTSSTGHTYVFSEGGMSPYDDLKLPGRTMLTSEGSVNRSTHFLKINGRYRLLTPIEAERMQAFPDNWTKIKLVNGEKREVSNRMRMFFMGNALVTDVIKRIGLGIKTIHEDYD